MNDSLLQKQLLDAHEAGDASALASLYCKVADNEETAGNTDAACFYLTQAYVFALEAGLPLARELNRKLTSYGRN